MDPTSKVLPKMKFGRTKVIAIMQNVIGEYSFSQIIEKLKTEVFSIIVDESNSPNNQQKFDRYGPSFA